MNNLIMTGMPTGMKTTYAQIQSETKTEIITQIMLQIKPYLTSKKQYNNIQKVLIENFENIELVENDLYDNTDYITSNQNLVEQFIENKRIKGLSERSLTYYESTLNRFINHLDKHIERVVADDIKQWIKTLKEKGDKNHENHTDLR